MFLTPAGVTLAERGGAQVREWLADTVDDLSPAEQRRLQALLEKLLGDPA